MENQTYSVQTDAPEEIKKWNWGAFAFSIWWGIGNRAYLPLLCLIPFFNIIWIFVCGAKGNTWAWKSGEYNSVEEFNKVQATWNRAGFVCFIVMIIAFVLSFILALTGAWSVSNMYSYY